MNFEDLRRIYAENFSLGYLSFPAKGDYSSFERKLILISLLCYLYSKNKPNNPDLTYYKLIYKLNLKANSPLPDNFMKGLSIVCESFAYGCSEFPTFGLKGKEILAEVFEIFNSYLPF